MFYIVMIMIQSSAVETMREQDRSHSGGRLNVQFNKNLAVLGYSQLVYLGIRASQVGAFG